MSLAKYTSYKSKLVKKSIPQYQTQQLSFNGKVTSNISQSPLNRRSSHQTALHSHNSSSSISMNKNHSSFISSSKSSYKSGLTSTPVPIETRSPQIMGSKGSSINNTSTFRPRIGMTASRHHSNANATFSYLNTSRTSSFSQAPSINIYPPQSPQHKLSHDKIHHHRSLKSIQISQSSRQPAVVSSQSLNACLSQNLTSRTQNFSQNIPSTSRTHYNKIQQPYSQYSRKNSSEHVSMARIANQLDSRFPSKKNRESMSSADFCDTLRSINSTQNPQRYESLDLQRHFSQSNFKSSNNNNTNTTTTSSNHQNKHLVQMKSSLSGGAIVLHGGNSSSKLKRTQQRTTTPPPRALSNNTMADNIKRDANDRLITSLQTRSSQLQNIITTYLTN